MSRITLIDAVRNGTGPAASGDERWLVELTATVGQYQYIATILGAFEVQPGPDRERIHG
jgi:hypothetical protein